MTGSLTKVEGREWQDMPDRSLYYTALIVTITLLVYSFIRITSPPNFTIQLLCQAKHEMPSVPSSCARAEIVTVKLSMHVLKLPS